MRAMVLEKPRAPLIGKQLERRPLDSGEVRVRVAACAVCRTDLHVVDGELPDSRLPIVPGHEIVGRVIEIGAGVARFTLGERVGIPWLGWTCGACEFCRRGQENLCPNARFTGYQIDGGYAEETIADARFVFPLPGNYDDREAAPLLCAGLIGWRALNAAGTGPRVGFYGFGAAAHLAVQAAQHRDQQVFAFVRPGDEKGRSFARAMGAVWAGYSDAAPPVPLDAAVIFAPVGDLVPQALRAVRPGGRVVCGGIHMSDIPAFPYAILWQERSVSSVANLTRKDAEDFLALAARTKFRVETSAYALEQANVALAGLRSGTLAGAAVLIP
ncbi:MAG TPA: zinc-dependent alcohol dehydrogenase family protein [Rhizomicrobium sp.]|jgi:propanol-preferring alcohol dehydrogenase|nr:zinc-dependent alcohol dehydrogenase family protein [Rhizomicrobium sp.]